MKRMNIFSSGIYQNTHNTSGVHIYSRTLTILLDHLEQSSIQYSYNTLIYMALQNNIFSSCGFMLTMRFFADRLMAPMLAVVPACAVGPVKLDTRDITIIYPG